MLDFEMAKVLLFLDNRIAALEAKVAGPAAGTAKRGGGKKASPGA